MQLNRELLSYSKIKRKAYSQYKEGQITRRVYEGIARLYRHNISNIKNKIPLVRVDSDNYRSFYKYIRRNRKNQENLGPMFSGEGDLLMLGCPILARLGPECSTPLCGHVGYTGGMQSAAACQAGCTGGTWVLTPCLVGSASGAECPTSPTSHKLHHQPTQPHPCQQPMVPILCHIGCADDAQTSRLSSVTQQ